MIYMMTPQSRKKVKPARKSSWKLILTITVVIALMLFAWMQEKSTAQEIIDQGEIVDLTKLWKWSDQLLAEGASAGEWSLRWDATLSTESFKELTEQFFENAKGEPLPKNIRKNGSLIDGEGAIKGSHLQLSTIDDQKNEQSTIILLQIEQGSMDKLESMRSFVTKIHTRILEEDAHATVSMKVFGVAKEDNSLKTLQHLAVAQIVDQYEDFGTKSSTLYSSSIQNYRFVNQEKMANLQLSEHQNSINGEVTITLAVPLISGEFGEIIQEKKTD